VVTNFVWISHDITKELELEKKMVQVQKMEALGALAGGIAHDFNNLLFPITGMSEMLMEDLPADSMNHEHVAEILKAAHRAGDLVNQILSFSRQSDHQKKPVRIQQVLREVLTLTRATIPSNIEIVQKIRNDCGLVMADPTQVHQIAMNLMTNAFHAVEHTGGKISIALVETSLPDGNVKHTQLEPGRYARMSVADTGHGIPPELLGKIFEPYFTTKPQGKGTGLGLSTVYGIVRQHNGDITVDSQLGQGTTMNIYLPLLVKTVPAEAAEPAEYVETGNERILLVDDEEPIVRLGRQMLERLGYRVTSRVSSLEALKAFKANPDAFDLVITDMTMPNMTGDQLAKALISHRPDIPVVVCTGFSERMDPQSAQALGIKGFLMKPVTKSDLARMVRKALDG
jgi:nitrogen-specific signal transduction histidine kinase